MTALANPHLTAILENDPLSERIRALQERLQAFVPQIQAATRRVTHLLLACSFELEAMEYNDGGIFIFSGVKERLQRTLKDDASKKLNVQYGGYVLAEGEEPTLMVASLQLSKKAQWKRSPAFSGDMIGDYERALVTPYDANRRTAREAVDKKPELFALSPEHEYALEVLMLVGDMRRRVETIRINREYGSKQDTSPSYAEWEAIARGVHEREVWDTIGWLEDNLPDSSSPTSLCPTVNALQNFS
jgi:hypothetical protein